jgi:metal-responsive CopG/Arc/MetJ family transcriptional regulator
MSKATVIRHGKKVRITLDVAESLVRDIDEIRKRIGVDRGALIKVWLHEKVKQEKAVRTGK